MDGIVLWSDTARDKAIVWCSDHGDLAFILNKKAMLGSSVLPAKGSLVSFISEVVNGQRICTSVVQIAQKNTPDLATALKEVTSRLRGDVHSEGGDGAEHPAHFEIMKA